MLRRNIRLAIWAGSCERSIAARTVSETPFAGAALGFVASALILSAGHWPALATLRRNETAPGMTAATKRIFCLFIVFFLSMRRGTTIGAALMEGSAKLAMR